MHANVAQVYEWWKAQILLKSACVSIAGLEVVFHDCELKFIRNILLSNK